MRRVLVIGGLGFCGSHLTDALKSQGDWVAVIDNFSQSTQATQDSKADEVIRADVGTSLRCVEGARFDYVIHAASPAGPARIEPGYALQKIVRSMRVVVDYAAHTKARLIKASTSEVYGRTDVELTEETPCLIPLADPRTEYPLGFLSAECIGMNSPYPNIQILRLFNVVGPRQQSRAGVVIPRFIEQAKAGEPLTIIKPGTQHRAFMDVSDLTSFVLTLMDQWPKTKGIWNVANPSNNISMIRLAEMVNEAVGNTAGVQFVDGKRVMGEYYRDGFEKLKIGIDKAKGLGWEPKVGMEGIIERCLR